MTHTAQDALPMRACSNLRLIFCGPMPYPQSQTRTYPCIRYSFLPFEQEIRASNSIRVPKKSDQLRIHTFLKHSTWIANEALNCS